MRATQLFFSLLISLCCLSFCACSDSQDAKAKEQAAIDDLMQQHCEKISKYSQEAYIKVYMMHNGNTADDRKEAIADYQSCLTRQENKSNTST